MVSFCEGVSYPLNTICNISWKIAVVFVVFVVFWRVFYPKEKSR